ncbi:MAG: CopG family transcriptional regulator [Vicinamibacteria bacterium]
MALYSVRLDEASEEALTGAARARKVSRAVILREAIADYAGNAAADVSPLARLSSLIGVIDDGPADLSERTGEKFAHALEQRRAATHGKTGSGPTKKSKRTT